MGLTVEVNSFNSTQSGIPGPWYSDAFWKGACWYYGFPSVPAGLVLGEQTTHCGRKIFTSQWEKTGPPSQGAQVQRADPLADLTWLLTSFLSAHQVPTDPVENHPLISVDRDFLDKYAWMKRKQRGNLSNCIDSQAPLRPCLFKTQDLLVMSLPQPLQGC